MAKNIYGLRGHISAGFSVIPTQKNPDGLGWTALFVECSSKTKDTAHTCSSTAPPVCQRTSQEIVEVGLIETYSLSSFLLLLILHSEQDEGRDS